MKLGTNAQSIRRRGRPALVEPLPEHEELRLHTPSLAALAKIEYTESIARCEASHLIGELAHDLRQPLTSLRMNVQCAMRLLQSASGGTPTAIEALAECLTAESDVVDLLTQAQRRFQALISGSASFALNDLAHDLIATVRCFQPHWRTRIAERLADPSPLVSGSAWRLRFSMLSLVSRVLLLDEWDDQARQPMVIETRMSERRAELALTEIHLPSVSTPYLHGLVDFTATAARRADGTADIVTRGPTAAIIVSLPLGVPPFACIDGGTDGD